MSNIQTKDSSNGEQPASSASASATGTLTVDASLPEKTLESVNLNRTSSKKAELAHGKYSMKQTRLGQLIQETKALSKSLFEAIGHLNSDFHSLHLMSDNIKPPDQSWIKQLQLLSIGMTDIMSHTDFFLDPREDDDFDSILIVKLLKSQLAQSIVHLDRLAVRVADKSSKVLVTGDLNAGKSTFVNAMLRRQVVPEDQQPCTNAFVQVVNAQANDNQEQVHAIRDIDAYFTRDACTFEKYELSSLKDLIENNRGKYPLIKVYCMDTRQKSLLNNGIVDISLIDSPGLNIDTMKTSALFAQQEEIDVVVFVVNAENHFTLSGKEFLSLAGKEKEFVFVVVNKFDLIKRKERCQADILEQISTLSPKTLHDADNLVHFVSAKQFLNGETESLSSFSKLEDCLRSFVLEKREKSKLAPVKLYLTNILWDMSVVCSHYIKQAKEQLVALDREFDEHQPVLDQLLVLKRTVLDRQDGLIDAIISDVESECRKLMNLLLDNLSFYSRQTEWPGILQLWSYVHNSQVFLVHLVSLRIERCSDYCNTKLSNYLDELRDNPLVKQLDFEYKFQLKLLDTDFINPPPMLLNASVASDNIAIVKEFVPGASLVLTGLTGNQIINSFITKSSIRWSPGFIQGSQILFTGVAMTGLGILAYLFLDLKHLVQSQLVSNIRKHFVTTHFVDYTVEKIKKSTKKSLRQVFLEFEGEHKRKLSVINSKSTINTAKRSSVITTRCSFAGIYDKCKELSSQLTKVEIKE